MDLRMLSRLVAVAELGSMNKAARHLNLSQPALSKSIQLLEERFSVSLMDRSSSGVSLTSFGEAVFLHAKLIEAELRKLHGEIEALRHLTVGEVTLGAPLGPGFISRILATATLRLTSDGRRLTVTCITGTRRDLIQPLLLGELDFAVAVLADDASGAELAEEELYTDRLALVVRPGHPLLLRREVGLDDLVRHSWVVLRENTDAETTLRRMAREAGSTFDGSLLRSNSSLFIKAILMRSDFVGLVRQDTVRVELDEGDLAELPLRGTLDAVEWLATQRVGLIHRRDVSLSTASQALMREIRAECAKAGRRTRGG